jgi:hypothetical protein
MAAGVAIAAFAAGHLPAAEPDPMAPHLEAMKAAADPSAAVAAYAAGLAVNQSDPRLYEAYIRRMLDFGELALVQQPAAKLAELDPSNGLAWGILATNAGASRQMNEALTDILKALKLAPDDPFVLNAAGQLFAWYDKEPDKSAVSPAIGDEVERVSATLKDNEAYAAGYKVVSEQLAADAKAAESAQAPASAPTAGPVGADDQQPGLAAADADPVVNRYYYAPTIYTTTPYYGYYPYYPYYSYPWYGSYPGTVIVFSFQHRFCRVPLFLGLLRFRDFAHSHRDFPHHGRLLVFVRGRSEVLHHGRPGPFVHREFSTGIAPRERPGDRILSTGPRVFGPPVSGPGFRVFPGPSSTTMPRRETSDRPGPQGGPRPEGSDGRRIWTTRPNERPIRPPGGDMRSRPTWTGERDGGRVFMRGPERARPGVTPSWSSGPGRPGTFGPRPEVEHPSGGGSSRGGYRGR